MPRTRSPSVAPSCAGGGSYATTIGRGNMVPESDKLLSSSANARLPTKGTDRWPCMRLTDCSQKTALRNSVRPATTRSKPTRLDKIPGSDADAEISMSMRAIVTRLAHNGRLAIERRILVSAENGRDIFTSPRLKSWSSRDNNTRPPRGKLAVMPSMRPDAKPSAPGDIAISRASAVPRHSDTSMLPTVTTPPKCSSRRSINFCCKRDVR